MLNHHDYEPSFANWLWLSMVNGWWIFKEIILAVVNLWMLILMGTFIFFFIRYLIRRDKEASGQPFANLVDKT